ncbi:hypothetical protein RvY_07321 [Ramazzottius varieornatus]|uniref:Uncharacterized protein n=1 Tax=Ramazzottius varieornatus TaxID=947166 RepID=A0A1D1V4W5_RAMVA|nr:hypothetical protein RvY_07321 [Ramazzottius varieornatus]
MSPNKHRDVCDICLGMPQTSSLPNLKVGCLWTPRPYRSLRCLTSESYIPILKPANIRHFILLAKYRPQISFFKGATAWDWAALKARTRLEETVVPADFITEEQEQRQEGDGDHLAAQTEERISFSIDRKLTEFSAISELPEIKQKTSFPVQRPISAARPGSAGWPDLHTARRCLTRQKPRGKVSNEEMYASLRKPTTVDILGWSSCSIHSRFFTHSTSRQDVGTGLR